MSAGKSRRWAIRVAAFAVLAIFGLAVSWDVLWGQGEMVVVAPAGAKLELFVAGEPVGAVEDGNYLPVRLSRFGSHRVEVKNLETGATSVQKLRVGSLTRRTIVPADDKQCFALVEILEMFHLTDPGLPPEFRPRLKRRFLTGRPFSVAIEEPWPLPRTVFLGTEPKNAFNMPHIREIDVLIDLPCELAHREEEIYSRVKALL